MTKIKNKAMTGGLFEKIPSEEDDSLESVKSPYKIYFYGADYTLSVLKQKIDDNEIIVPDFQRGYVWDWAWRWR